MNKYLEKIAAIKPIVEPVAPKNTMAALKRNRDKDALSARASLEHALEQTARSKSLRELIDEKAKKSARATKRTGGNPDANAVKAMQRASQIPASSGNITKQRLK